MGHEARDRLRSTQQRERQKTRRRRGVLTGAAIVGVLALVVGVGIAVQANRSDTSVASSQPPQGTVARYGIPRGQQSAPVTVTMFEDFQCPVCREVEGFIGQTLTQLVNQGRVHVIYRPIAFLDEASTTEYSSRALNAAGCVLNANGPSAFVRMHELLYAHQPPEGSDGLSDTELTQLAVRAGADQAQMSTCIRQRRFAGWVAAATEQASKQHIVATPTILVNGKRLNFTAGQDPATTLREAVAAAS